MNKIYCGLCDRETERDMNSVFKGDCPYHQRVINDSEEGPYMAYDEFNQDGEAW